MRHMSLVALLSVGLAGGAVARAEEGSSDGTMRTMTFAIEIASTALESSTSSSDRWLPGRDVFVVAPAIAQKHANRQGREWLLRQPPFLQRQEHEFDVRDEAIVPAALIALVGDTVKRTARDGRPIQMVSTSYPPSGLSSEVEPVIRLHKCDPAPLMFVAEAVGKPVRPAYIVVSDHGFGRVTNDAGVAEFDEWPIGCDMQVVIWCPGIKSPISMTSSTVEISPTGKCTIPAGGDPETHTIRIDSAGKR